MNLPINGTISGKMLNSAVFNINFNIRLVDNGTIVNFYDNRVNREQTFVFLSMDDAFEFIKSFT